MLFIPDEKIFFPSNFFLAKAKNKLIIIYEANAINFYKS